MEMLVFIDFTLCGKDSQTISICPYHMETFKEMPPMNPINHTYVVVTMKSGASYNIAMTRKEFVGHLYSSLPGGY